MGVLSRVVLAAGLFAGAGPLACSAEDDDRLSPESLQRLARAQGDAVGDAFSGAFMVGGEPLGCDCPDDLEVDLCDVLSVTAPILTAQVSHHDGLVVLEISGAIALIGGVESDGSFAVASILDAGLIGAGGQILSLAEGSFGPSGFSAELTNRFSGVYLDRSVDCRANSFLIAGSAP